MGLLRTQVLGEGGRAGEKKGASRHLPDAASIALPQSSEAIYLNTMDHDASSSESEGHQEDDLPYSHVGAEDVNGFDSGATIARAASLPQRVPNNWLQ